MRLMSFLALWYAFFITTLVVVHWTGTNITPDIYIIAVVIIAWLAAFAPKAIQKFAENSNLLNKGNGAKP